MGYLLPWAQINSWNYFRMPWVQGRELLAMHKTYSRLRARLIPYLYTWAWQATQTGQPLLRPLTLEFQDDMACRKILHEFLLGRDLLVSVYKPRTYFPRGRWKDYWTGRVIDGPATRTVRPPAGRGGGLYVRSGGIVPHGPLMQYRREREVDEINLYVFPDGQPSRLELYEDDGVSFEHHRGRFAVTPISARSADRSAIIQVGQTRGTFAGQTASRTWSFTVAVDFEPSAVSVNGQALAESAWEFDRGRGEVSIDAVSGPVKVKIT
jgi:alpha-glucosidase (family GH31 glycosyl hydrolase)